MKALRRSSSFTRLFGSGLPDLTRDCTVVEDDEEEGSWSYLVVDPLGVLHRQVPVYEKGFSTKSRSTEGTVLSIDRRFKHAWTTWLRIRNSGEWVFDVSPKDRQVLLIEVDFVRLACCYRLDEAAPLACPCFRPRRAGNHEVDMAATVTGMLKAVKQKAAWLQLEGGQGWLTMSDNMDLPLDNTTASTGSDREVVDRELGMWDYLVIDPQGAQVYVQAAQRGSLVEVNETLQEGTLASVTERHVWQRGRHLSIGGGRWVNDQSVDRSGIASRVTMMEVYIERGTWFYRIDIKQGIGLRRRLSWANSAKSWDRGPEHGDVVEIRERINFGETTFLKLADKSGWIFDKKKGKSLVTLLNGYDPTDSAEKQRIAALAGSDVRGNALRPDGEALQNLAEPA
mmetsp:Transcript_11233/g.21191  ORF Transcript_11233/g.21191 Transcript_11233/m.21191 type:complete len:397 (-) Transcript_11233:46-1236(-)